MKTLRSKGVPVRSVTTLIAGLAISPGESHAPLRLSKELKAFVEGNGELLAREGLIPKRDEGKPDEKTTAKFSVDQGLTIIHENQRYKITTVEQDKIGDLEVRRYRTIQGEEFIHIPRKNMIIPPYETPWYGLPPSTKIYLEKEYKRELPQAATSKAGNRPALQLKLGERGTKIGDTYLYDHLHGRLDGIGVDKLIPILTYLNRDLDEPADHITAIGHCRAIENPHHPFRLNTIDGARLHAARFSDGTLFTHQDTGTIFQYTNTDAEQRNRIIGSLINVFGKANIDDRKHEVGRVPRVATSTDIIGYVLRRSGGMTGEVVAQNPDIQAFIMQGPKEMKREWLIQVFGDEGSCWPQRGLVKLTRAVDATHRLSDEQRSRLDALSRRWKGYDLPKEASGNRRQMKSCKFDALPMDIREALKLERSHLLESEARMLHDDFAVATNRYPTAIYKRESGYGIKWVLLTASPEDSRTFYNEIGFPQKRKEETLRRTLGI